MSQVPATLDDSGQPLATGLEDFGVEDTVIPRLKIVHKLAVFEDTLSGEQFGSLTAIMLGVVKQRVLWHPDLEDGDWPMCRSANHDIGFPNLSDEQPKDKRFPWEKSKFDPKDYPVGDDGKIRLPCAGCNLKEWKSHPDGKKPYCSEQFTIPLYYDATGDEDWVPAIISFQKTALKPLKTYLSSFARSRGASFEAITEITLDPQSRGQTDYAVPKFRRTGTTDTDDWRGYSASYLSLREFLVAEPGSRDEDEDEATPPAASDNTVKPPAQVAEPPAAKDEPVDAEVVEVSEESATPADDKDDLPF